MATPLSEEQRLAVVNERHMELLARLQCTSQELLDLILASDVAVAAREDGNSVPVRRWEEGLVEGGNGRTAAPTSRTPPTTTANAEDHPTATAGDFTEALKNEIEQLVASKSSSSSGVPEEVIARYETLRWLASLPDACRENKLGLALTPEHISAVYGRAVEQLSAMLGATDPQYADAHNAFIARATEAIQRRVEKQLGECGTPPVEEETARRLAELKTSCRLTQDAPWLQGLCRNEDEASQPPAPAAVVDGILAMILYRDEGPTNGVKPGKPENARTHGPQLTLASIVDHVLKHAEDEKLPRTDLAVVHRTIRVFTPLIKMVDKALGILPTAGQRTFFRGVSTQNLWERFAVGDAYDLKGGFQTISSDDSHQSANALDPEKPGSLLAFVSHSAVAVSAFSSKVEVEEALLARHSKFVVTAKQARMVNRMLGSALDVVHLVQRGVELNAQQAVDAIVDVWQQTSPARRSFLKRTIPPQIEAAAAADQVSSVVNSDPAEAHREPLKVVMQRWLEDSCGPRHAMLVAEAGEGLTTAALTAYCEASCVSSSSSSGPFAVFLRLPAIRDLHSGGAIDTAIFEDISIEKASFQLLCQQRGVVVVLDGFDEVSPRSTGPDLVLDSLFSANPMLVETGVRVVVTCRREVARSLAIEDPRVLIAGTPSSATSTASAVVTVGDIALWNLLTFTNEAATEFADRYVMSKGVQNAQPLVRSVLDGPAESLSRSPTTLRMLLHNAASSSSAEAQAVSAVPISLWGVYDRFVSTYLAPNDTQLSSLREQLCRVALDDFLLKNTWHTTVGFLEDRLGCSSDVLSRLPLECEGFAERSATVMFVNRTVAEFLAAEQLSRMPKDQRAAITAKLMPADKIGTLRFLMLCPVQEAADDAALDAMSSCNETSLAMKHFTGKLQQQEADLGPDHLDLAATLATVGTIADKQDNNGLYLAMMERSLAIEEKHSGPDHVAVAPALHHLGVAYRNKGDNAKFLELTERSLQLKEQHYGNTDLELAITLRNLGLAYGRKGDNTRFLELTQRALAIQEEHLDPMHVELAETLVNLGSACDNEGDNDKFFALTERALAIQELHFGTKHFVLAETLYNLGRACANRNEFEAGVRHIDRALQLREARFGPDSMELVVTLITLGLTYSSAGNDDMYLNLTERALSLEESHYAPGQIELAATLANLGRAYGKHGDNDKYRQLTERALAIEEAHYGPQNIAVAATVSNLGQVFRKLGDSNSWLQQMQRALAIREAHYGPNHLELAGTLNSLGLAYDRVGDNEKYLEVTERALEIQERHLGSHDVALAPTLVNLGLAYRNKGDTEKYQQLTHRKRMICGRGSISGE